jgi:hypothetical protein
MIKPHPESDLNLNILVLGADIINILKGKKDSYSLVENVLSEFMKKDSRRTPDLFIYSLIFLFSIGVIDQKGYKVKLTPKQVTEFDIFGLTEKS